MEIIDIQKALKKQGYKPGALNGAWGRQSINALKAFQQAHGLKVDGVLDAETVGALDAGGATSSASTLEATSSTLPPAPTLPLVWYEEARRQLGTREKPGPASNPKIIQWAGQLGIRYKGDDIPWCGLFAAHCVGSTLPEEPLPTNPLGARNWAKFGSKCKPMIRVYPGFLARIEKRKSWACGLLSRRGRPGFSCSRRKPVGPSQRRARCQESPLGRASACYCSAPGDWSCEAQQIWRSVEQRGLNVSLQ